MLKIVTRPLINADDLVIEIGSGNNPYPRSDILCDKFFNDNSERAGGFPILIDRPFIICDGYRLPFADKTIDYIICSHILEHMRNPHKFVKEITRVAKRGYIEVPTAVSERIFGWDIHHWLINFKDGTIFMYKKSPKTRHHDYYHNLILRNISFRRWFEQNETSHYLKLEWQNDISLKTAKYNNMMTRKYDINADELLRSYKPELISDAIFLFKWIMKRLIRKINKKIRIYVYWLKLALIQDFPLIILNQILVCPKCHGNIIQNERNYFCPKCNNEFEIKNRIPILLL